MNRATSRLLELAAENGYTVVVVDTSHPSVEESVDYPLPHHHWIGMAPRKRVGQPSRAEVWLIANKASPESVRGSFGSLAFIGEDIFDPGLYELSPDGSWTRDGWEE